MTQKSLATVLASIAAALLAGCQSAPVSRMPAEGIAGYLCCNLHPSSEWASDINYRDGQYPVLAVGTPARAVAYGNNRVRLDVDGRTVWLGNDYSRHLSMDAFTRRYLVAEDPTASLDAMPPRLRDAVRDSRVGRGMTRQQVAMALGYPIGLAKVDAPLPRWTYWTATGVDWHVDFDADGRVRDVIAGSAIRREVWAD